MQLVLLVITYKHVASRSKIRGNIVEREAKRNAEAECNAVLRELRSAHVLRHRAIGLNKLEDCAAVSDRAPRQGRGLGSRTIVVDSCRVVAERLLLRLLLLLLLMLLLLLLLLLLMLMLLLLLLLLLLQMLLLLM